MWDAIALGGAAELPLATAIPVFTAFEVLRGIIDQAVCQAKIDHQMDVLRQAYKLLPQKLITHDEQFALYSQLYTDKFPEFAAAADQVTKVRKAIETRWTQVMSFNAERNAAAHAVLTSARVESLRRAYERGDITAQILDSAVIIRLAEDIGRVNSYIAASEDPLSNACRNTAAFDALEKVGDTLRYATESYQAIRAQASLSPLQPLLQSSLDDIRDTQEELRRIQKR